jgi:hypothetical protein
MKVAVDHNTVRRGITLIVVGVTVVMVLVFSLSAYFTPASAGATFAASLCGDGSEREIANLDQ